MYSILLNPCEGTINVIVKFLIEVIFFWHLHLTQYEHYNVYICLCHSHRFMVVNNQFWYNNNFQIIFEFLYVPFEIFTLSLFHCLYSTFIEFYLHDNNLIKSFRNEHITHFFNKFRVFLTSFVIILSSILPHLSITSYQLHSVLVTYHCLAFSDVSDKPNKKSKVALLYYIYKLHFCRKLNLALKTPRKFREEQSPKRNTILEILYV